MKTPANIACNGAEKTPLDNKNNAAQQKMMGVVMNTLYGLLLPLLLQRIVNLSNFGSRTLRTITPNTVTYVRYIPFKVSTKYQLQPATPANSTNPPKSPTITITDERTPCNTSALTGVILFGCN